MIIAIGVIRGGRPCLFYRYHNIFLLISGFLPKFNSKTNFNVGCFQIIN